MRGDGDADIAVAGLHVRWLALMAFRTVLRRKQVRARWGIPYIHIFAFPFCFGSHELPLVYIL